MNLRLLLNLFLKALLSTLVIVLGIRSVAFNTPVVDNRQHLATHCVDLFHLQLGNP